MKQSAQGIEGRGGGGRIGGFAIAHQIDAGICVQKANAASAGEGEHKTLVLDRSANHILVPLPWHQHTPTLRKQFFPPCEDLGFKSSVFAVR